VSVLPSTNDMLVVKIDRSLIMIYQMTISSTLFFLWRMPWISSWWLRVLWG